MSISHEDALAELEEAYELLVEFEEAIEKQLEGEHPFSHQVSCWLNRYFKEEQKVA
jgi:predicted RNase H-like HicB family nuclease